EVMVIVRAAKELKLDEKKQRVEDLKLKLELDQRATPRSLDEIVTDALEGRVDKPSKMPTSYKVLRTIKQIGTEIVLDRWMYTGITALVEFIQEKRQAPDFKDWKAPKGKLEAVGVHLGKFELAVADSSKEQSPEAHAKWRAKAEAELARIEGRLNHAKIEAQTAAGPALAEEDRIAAQEALFRPGLQESIAKLEADLLSCKEGIKLGEKELKDNEELDKTTRQEMNDELSKLRKQQPRLEGELRKLKQTLENLERVLKDARKPIKAMLEEYKKFEEYAAEKQERIDKLRNQLDTDARTQESKKRHQERGLEASFEDAMSGEVEPEKPDTSSGGQAVKLLKKFAQFSFPPLGYAALAQEAATRIRQA